MGASLLLAASVLALVLLCAWAVPHCGKGSGQPRAKLCLFVRIEDPEKHDGERAPGT